MKRELRRELAAIFFDRMHQNGLYHDALRRKDARTVMRLAAESLVGVREEGQNAGRIVTLIQDTVGPPDHVAWCMSFVQSCIAFAENQTGIKSPLAVSEHCLTVWRETPSQFRVATVPDLGAVAIWQHNGSSAGHTGITVSPVKEGFHSLVEGNTSNGIDESGSVVREGDGIYLTRRSIHGSGSMKLLGWLRPFPRV